MIGSATTSPPFAEDRSQPVTIIDAVSPITGAGSFSAILGIAAARVTEISPRAIANTPAGSLAETTVALATTIGDPPAHAASIADRFNEKGFFANSDSNDADPPSSPVPGMPPSLSPNVPAKPAENDGPAEIPVAQNRVRAGTIAAPSSLETSGKTKVSPSPTPAAPSRPPMPLSGFRPAAPITMPPDGDTGTPTTKPSSPRAARVANTAPVAIALQAIENGLTVVARVDALADDDRAALTDAIAALLARHGYSPRSITIVARPSQRGAR